MGQYYRPIILSKDDADVILAWLSPYSYGNGAKLVEHSIVGNRFVAGVEALLSPGGEFEGGARIVWAGDYADADRYERCEAIPEVASIRILPVERYPVIVNHTKALYVKKGRKGTPHALPLLTADGNGCGGGDVMSGPWVPLIGTWACDIISVEEAPPADYTELVVPETSDE